LVRAGLLPADWPYTVNAVSGYSGGGKALIERFETDPDIAFRAYGLTLDHKHLPEMQIHAGLAHVPIFAPAVIPAHRGMVVEVPLPLSAMNGAADPAALRDALARFYAGSPIVTVHDSAEGELLLRRSGEPTDRLELHVFASADGKQARLIALLDNLGKGASGAAVQSLNLMAGLPETAGLRL
jgi:N-acetyl-gamma-glutamyl-phosphate reductase